MANDSCCLYRSGATEFALGGVGPALDLRTGVRF